MSKLLIIIGCLFGYADMLIAQQLTHYLAEHPEYPKFLNGVIVSDIVYPGNDFSGIDYLGPALESKSDYRSSERTSVIRYSGLELHYVDKYGEPELHRLHIDSPEHRMTYQNEVLRVGKVLKTELENVSFERIDAGMTDRAKYMGSFQFLEVIVDGSGKIVEIIFQRDLQ